MKMKETFKVGDRIFHIKYGWGVVIEEINCHGNLKIAFDKEVPQWDWFDKSFISFTEYTLQGFSQERPIVLPNVGELCLVRDYNDDTWLAREFAEYRHGLFICQAVHGQGEVEWKYMKRIKILD